MERVAARFLVALMRLVTGVRVRWEVPLAASGPRVYVANHTSHLDGLVVWAALPPAERARTRPVAAGDYWSGRVKGWLARDVFGAVFVERGGADRETLPRLLDVLDGGGALILFPEGTRGDGEAVGPFRSGLFHLVDRRPQAEVVPVRLENLSRSLPKGKTVPVPLLGRASFGAPLTLSPGEAREAFLGRVRAAVERLGDP